MFRVHFMKAIVSCFAALFWISIAPMYAGSYALTSLHVFTVLSGTSPATNYDGADPTTGLILVSNVLYGTTRLGGISNDGTIFRLNADGTGFTNLYNFTNGTDGANPAGPGTLVYSSNALFGVTGFGGNGSPPRKGAVFRINTDGTGFTNIYSFSGPDGQNPSAQLTMTGGTLYGVTHSGGGTGKHGTIFEINPDGSGFQTMFAFSGTNGSVPSSPLTLSGGTFYGVTLSGSNGFGSVYRINADQSGFTNLYSFTGGLDGYLPEAALTVFSNQLFGTTTAAGISNMGTIFRLNTDGSGFTPVHEFLGTWDAGVPFGGVTVYSNVLYGAALDGNSSSGNYGIIYRMNPDGTGFTNVYNFSGGNDGAGPESTMVLNGNTLYGITPAGGSAFSTSGDGTLFAVTLPVSLAISRSNASYTIVWPSPSTGFVLQTNGNLLSGTWAGYGSPNDDGTNRTINISSAKGNLFFRLMHP
jgi:uncharacterized repeat protein (TIGR03803 family)